VSHVAYNLGMRGPNWSSAPVRGRPSRYAQCGKIRPWCTFLSVNVVTRSRLQGSACSGSCSLPGSASQWRPMEGVVDRQPEDRSHDCLQEPRDKNNQRRQTSEHDQADCHQSERTYPTAREHRFYKVTETRVEPMSTNIPPKATYEGNDKDEKQYADDDNLPLIHTHFPS
jgi:hypothetical protein